MTSILPPARLLLLPLFLAAFAISNFSLGAANDWPHWRGPNANGSISGGEYPVKWSASNVTWKVALPGKGTSTPIVNQDRIYLTSPAEGQNTLMAFDFTGRSLWQVKVGLEDPPKHRSLASSGNASPVTDGKAVFVYFKSGDFAAVELNGNVRWKINLVERFGRDRLFWDQGSSPVLTDQHVIMVRLHGGESWIAAFDKATGELRWKQPRDYEAPTENNNGYTTPVLFEHSGKKALLIWGADHLTAHDAADGKVLWVSRGFNPEGTGYWPAIATPAIVGGVAVVPVGRDDRPGQARVHGIRLGGSGDVTTTHRAWKREDLGVFVASPAIYKGRAYLLRHKGEVVCLDPSSGKTVWTGSFPEHRAPYYSSPVIANGVFYAAREDGTIFTARVEEKFELLGENPMGERVIASPVPASNRLLIRGDNHLFCIGK
jgi:outer membrane protein assembly factor BamB